MSPTSRRTVNAREADRELVRAMAELAAWEPPPLPAEPPVASPAPPPARPRRAAPPSHPAHAAG
jgi:hypothetical protein